MSSLLKGGRVTATRSDVVNFISSLSADKRIALSTVLVNEAHVIALEKCGAIQKPYAHKILNALHALERRKIASQNVEDVHVAIEEFVNRRAGSEVGGLMHLGKSRNDQVVTAIRMTLRNEILELSQSLLQFELALIRLAKKHITSVFPGYTHLQPAQPISFAHYLLANCFASIRDSERLLEAYARINLSPMGAAAIAGTSVHLDRALVARLLGFDDIVEASLDAVGGRDFALEALAAAALIATDLSRISADILFYASAEAGLIEIPDGFASTSSIMPQKKNADPVELIRGKTAKIAGEFAAAVTLMHGLPSGYNLDYQEITPMLWQSFDELRSCLQILTALVAQVRLNKGIAERSYLQFTAATEIANVLVREENLPFRVAHQKVGLAVKSAVKRGKLLSEMADEDWRGALGFPLNQRTLKLIARTLDLKLQINTYQTAGSSSPRETERLIVLAMTRCRELGTEVTDARTRLDSGLRQLRRLVSMT